MVKAALKYAIIEFKPSSLIIYIFLKSRCVADILRQIVLNFSPKEYESEILHVQIIHDGFEDSLQQLSPANDIVMNRDYLEQGDLSRGIAKLVS